MQRKRPLIEWNPHHPDLFVQSSNDLRLHQLGEPAFALGGGGGGGGGGTDAGGPDAGLAQAAAGSGARWLPATAHGTFLGGDGVESMGDGAIAHLGLGAGLPAGVVPSTSRSQSAPRRGGISDHQHHLQVQGRAHSQHHHGSSSSRRLEHRTIADSDEKHHRRAQHSSRRRSHHSNGAHAHTSNRPPHRSRHHQNQCQHRHHHHHNHHHHTHHSNNHRFTRNSRSAPGLALNPVTLRQFTFKLVSVISDTPYVRCLDWCRNPANSLVLAGGVELTGAVAIANFQSSGSAGPSIHLIPPPSNVGRPCNAVAWDPISSSQVAAGLDKIRNEYSILLWDVNQLEGATDAYSSSAQQHFGAAPSQQHARPQVNQGGTPVVQLANSEGTAALGWAPSMASCLVVGTTYKWLRVYDVRTAPSSSGSECVASVVAHSRAVQGIFFDPFTPTSLASFSDDGYVCVWDHRKLVAPLATVQTGSKNLLQVAWSQTQQGILSTLSADDRALSFWNVSTSSTASPAAVVGAAGSGPVPPYTRSMSNSNNSSGAMSRIPENEGAANEEGRSSGTGAGLLQGAQSAVSSPVVTPVATPVTSPPGSPRRQPLPSVAAGSSASILGKMRTSMSTTSLAAAAAASLAASTGSGLAARDAGDASKARFAITTPLFSQVYDKAVCVLCVAATHHQLPTHERTFAGRPRQPPAGRVVGTRTTDGGSRRNASQSRTTRAGCFCGTQERVSWTQPGGYRGRSPGHR